MARKKVLSVALAAMLSTSTVFGSLPQFSQIVSVNAKKTTSEDQDVEETEVVTDAEQVDASSYGLCDNTKDGAILHAFCWSFNTIKENMKDIAEAGYTTVQTSPANACNDSSPGMILYDPNNKDDSYDGKRGCWWWHYQPTDWTVGNYQLGTRDDYKAMCEEADKYGVKIITDVLPNHTTPDIARVSDNLANAAGGKGKGQLYHENGFNEINDYNNRYECTLGQMGGLPDVNTENQGFQAYYLKYCNDIISLGCDGFRYDTAKHIGVPSDPKDSSNTRGVNDFWDIATGKKAVNGISLNKADELFIYGEVLQDRNIPYNEYASYMNMTASGYGGTLRSAIGSKDFSTGRISDWNHATPNRIVTWVESHDTYFNKHESAWLNDWQIRACWAIIAARDNGTPLFFSRPDGSDGPSTNYVGNNVLGAKGNDQFKHPEVAACNRFRNAMVGEKEYLSNPNGSGSLLAIERGNKGVVIVNLGSDASNIKLQKVADGTYTEEVSGKQVQVSGGTLNYTVPGGTVAVVYNPTAITKDPSVSVSKDTGTFTDPFDLKLTPVNATKATYSINGGEAVEFTKATTVKIGEGCEIGDKVTVKVTATGEGEPFEKTFTYTMADAPQYKMYLRVKKSDFDSAPTLYLYDSETGKTALNGAWPGNAMTAEGDYYVYTSDTVDSGVAILVSGTWRSTEDMQPGLSVNGYMEYDKSSNKFSTFTIETKPPVTKEPTKEPEKTATPKPSSTATTTPIKTATPKPENTATSNSPSISVSVEDGSSFTTETESVKVKLANATKGTYRVDNGPEKSFGTSTTVVLGQGKIADTDVTLEVTAVSGSKEVTKTFTYHKVFDGEKVEVKASALQKLQSLFEVVAEAAQTNTAAESDAYYATNPDGKLGKEATITGMADFTQDMLVARSGAWDVPNAWNGAHENSVADCYGLYAAWDSDNLYIGLEMVNTTDTWANGGEGPLLDGGKMSNVPIVLALNTGKGNKMTGKCPSDMTGHVWQCNLEFETRIDHLLFSSAQGTGDPGMFTAGADGNSDYKENLVSFKDAGITLKIEDGSIAPEIMHLVGSSDVADAHDSSKYQDAMKAGHDRKYDTFFTYTIPLKALNIDKSYIEANGVGIMGLGTRQTSALDCIPHDPSMLDNTMEAYSAGDNTSYEKEDLDIITVPLAAVGNAKGGGEGSGEVSKTEEPKKTEQPTKTNVPEKTAGATKTETPKKTEEPTKTETPKKTDAPLETAVVATSNPGDKFTVNFGADRSSPQLNTTKLNLKAVAYSGKKSYKYEFLVDGETVQKASTKDTYSWSPSTGNHTIKVIVEDADGTKISCEKKYVIESTEGQTTPSTKPTTAPTKEPTKTALPKPTDSVVPSGELMARLKFSAVSPQKVGKAIGLNLVAVGGTAPYKYSITVTDKTGKPVRLLNKSNSGTVTWKPSKAGTYKIYCMLEDANGDVVIKNTTYTIKASKTITVKGFKASKYAVAKGKSVKFTMKAVSSNKGKVQYKLSVQKKGTSKKVVIKKYSSKATFTWKTKKKGKYTIYLTVKDAKGKTTTKKLSKQITVK